MDVYRALPRLYRQTLEKFKDELPQEIIDGVVKWFERDLCREYIHHDTLAEYFDDNTYVGEHLINVYDTDKMSKEEEKEFDDWVEDISTRIADAFYNEHKEEFDEWVEEYRENTWGSFYEG